MHPSVAFLFGAVWGAWLMVAVYYACRPAGPPRDARGRFVKRRPF